MPADVSYLFGVSPPFHQSYNSTYSTTLSNTKSYCRSPYSVFSTQKLNLSPCFARKAESKALKPCIKATSQDADTNFLRISPTLEYVSANTSSITDTTADQEITLTVSSSIPKKEKRVTFADSHGQSLTTVKFVTESSNEPPHCVTTGELARKFERNLKIGQVNDESDENEQSKFAMQFKQPVSDYVNFKQELERKNVMLENVVVKDNKLLHGTVKVKNLAFHKSVVVRMTCDNWATFKDYECHYVKDAYENGKFDTFQFNIAIPCISENMECIMFCLKYVCNGSEYWDSHEGKNYQINIVRSKKIRPFSALHLAPTSEVHQSSFPSTYNELPGPEFNSWNTWEGTGPFY